uniref:Right handed beta helix domain-containing protein n=1 Tax=Trichogramma kaykai TaxID=54128 RepID=A0ABD2X239_9HYME
MTCKNRQALSLLIGATLTLFLIVVGQVADVAAAAATSDRRVTWMRAQGICTKRDCNCTINPQKLIFIKCTFGDQNYAIGPGSIPENTAELEISNLYDFKIRANAFVNSAKLTRVHLADIKSLHIEKQAFHNLSSVDARLQLSGCKECDLTIDSQAFKNARSPLTIDIERYRLVDIKPNAFSWLKEIGVRDVQNLRLSSNAFKFEAAQLAEDGPTTKIMFQGISNIQELPTAVFPSTLAEIRMDNVRISYSIRKDAFCAMNIMKVAVSNSSIYEIESGAFSDRTLIGSLEFVDVKIDIVRNEAFQAGANALLIDHSEIQNMEKNAIVMTVATATLSYTKFCDLRYGSIVFHQWNRIYIDNNSFYRIAADSIHAVFDVAKASSLEFSFSGNYIGEAEPNSLSFVGISQAVSVARVGSNRFNRSCYCNIESWVRERVGSNASVSWIMDSSYCTVDKFLSNCYDLPDSYLGMRNYTQTICTPSDNIKCNEEPVNTHASSAAASPPSIGPHQYPKRKGFFDVEMSDPEQLEREKRIIIVACIVAVFSLVLMIFVFVALYMRRRGVCPKLSSGPLNPNTWFEPTSGMTAATSVSRLSVHEYTGLQPETRILDVTSHEDPEVDLEAAAESSHSYSYQESKATQTLPEELTEEYLRELKEQLNDPQNYAQAKGMIEHLYDLIKVEESCNNNNNNKTNAENGESYRNNTSRQIRRDASFAERQPSVTVGTKVPSLDKLITPSVARSAKPELADYCEPQDRQMVDQNHLYAELPGDDTVPSTSRLSEPMLASLAGRAPLPLPPDVINDLSTEPNGSLVYGIEADESRSLHSSQENNTTSTPKTTDGRRPMSFFKALGDTFAGPKKVNGRRPNSLLSEYADPSDVTLHLYSELPDSRQLSSGGGGGGRPASTTMKMVNRPLPTKPDQYESEPMTVRS